MQTPSDGKSISRKNLRYVPVRPALAGIIILLVSLVVFPPGSCAAVPAASFVSNVSEGDTPLHVQFIDTSTNTPTSWFWSFGDGGSSTEQNPVHTYANEGTYTVILAATNSAGTDTETESGYITASKSASAPVAAFVSNTTGGTIPFAVQFVDMSGNSPSSWIWSFGDGGTSTEQSPVHAYTTSGTFTVTLTVTNDAGSNTVTKADYIVAGKVAMIPKAKFISSVTEGTAPLTVQFVDSTTNAPTSWIWSFGDGNISTVQNPTHTYLTSDTFTVTLIATNSAGSDTETKNNYITVTYKEPVANFTADVTSGTAPFIVQFTDLSENAPTSWSWKFGDGGKSSDQDPTHEYLDAGTYSVTLTAKNSAGSDTEKFSDYITVSAPASPVAAFTAEPTSGNVPLAVRFTDTSSNSPASWLWTFGDGSSSTEKNPSHTYSASGRYTVSLMVENAAGNNTKTATDYISVNGLTMQPSGTTVPVTDGTPGPRETTAPVTPGQTTTPAPESGGSSSTSLIIAVIVAVVAIGAIALLYIRNRGSGGQL